MEMTGNDIASGMQEETDEGVDTRAILQWAAEQKLCSMLAWMRTLRAKASAAAVLWRHEGAYCPYYPFDVERCGWWRPCLLLVSRSRGVVKASMAREASRIGHGRSLAASAH
jgi:hypothetical protein